MKINGDVQLYCFTLVSFFHITDERFLAQFIPPMGWARNDSSSGLFTDPSKIVLTIIHYYEFLHCIVVKQGIEIT